MPKSEIVHLREQIEQEHAASVQALNGFASGMARHEFINARIERLEVYHHRLAELVGEKQATAFVCQILDRIPETPTNQQFESAGTALPSRTLSELNMMDAEQEL